LHDLAFDGEFLYGSVGTWIFGIDPFNGRVEFAIQPEVDLLATYRAIAYIPEEDALWFGDRDDTWYKVSIERPLIGDPELGDVIDRVLDHGLTGVVGMAWNPVDPDGANLYIHNQESENGGGKIYRYNPENGEMHEGIETVGIGNGFPGGIFTTYLYNTHSYILGVLIQEENRDIVKLYQLQQHEEWLSVDHSYGEIDGHGETVLTATFNSAGFLDANLQAAIELHDLRANRAVLLHCRMIVDGEAGSVFGTVTLEGEPLEPEVLITDVVITLGDRQLNPDELGLYRFDLLVPGDYILEAEVAGYEPYTSDVIGIDHNAEIEHNFALTPLPFGTIQGTVISIYNDAVMEGVEVTAMLAGEEYVFFADSTDEEGDYSITVPAGTYNVAGRKIGWIADPVEGVEVNRDDLIENIDFRMDDHLAVTALRADGYYDDRIVLNWLPAGSGGDFDTLLYDDGVLANGAYLVNRNDIIASKFFPEGRYDILSLSIYILTEDDQEDFGLEPNGDNALFYKVFLEDPENGMPDEDRLIVDAYVIEHNDWNAEGWTTVGIDNARFLEGPFFFGWNRDPDRRWWDFEIGGLDESYNEGTCYLRIDDIWQQYDEFPGDLMARVVIWSHEEQQRMVIEPGYERNARTVQQSVSRLTELDPESMRIITPDISPIPVAKDPFNWRDIYPLVHIPRRDDFSCYQIYVDDELREDEWIDLYWTDDIGSGNENTEYTYRIETVYADMEDPPLGVEITARANMPPRPMRFPGVITDGVEYRVTWFPPTVNADSSELVDYAGTEIYLEDELIATVFGEENHSYLSSVEVGDEGWYKFTLIARDEVPNRSTPVEISAPLGASVYCNFESLDPPVFDADPDVDGWERSSSRISVDGAHGGSFYWGTSPEFGRYEDNADWYATTEDEFLVETENAALEFHHYVSTEDGHDGGQLFISVDGGDWELFVPDEGYHDDRVNALGNTPGFTGTTDDWELVSFDLSRYEGHSVRFRLRFASDGSISWFAGWYIDDIVLWSCSIPEYASLFGTVTDQGDNNAVSGVTVVVGRTSVVTGDEGDYILTGLIPGEYDVTFSKPGYRSAEVQVVLEAGVNRELDLQIFRPDVQTEPGSFELNVGAGDQFGLEFSLINNNDEPLSYLIRLNATDGGLRDAQPNRMLRSINGYNPGRDDPWDIHFDFDLNEVTSLSRCQGGEFAGGKFYITGLDNYQRARLVILERNGESISLSQPPVEQVGWGLRDLAWDGRYLYGSQDRDIYCFDIIGRTIRQFSGAPLAVNRALAYDPEEDGLWTTELDEPWYLIDMNGQVQFEWFDHGLTGVYGLAYHPEDDVGLPLYALNLEDDGSTGIYRADPYRGIIEDVHQIEGAPSGCFITGSWDADFWILGAMFDLDGAHLTGLELRERTGWIHADPFNGQIGSNDAVDITLAIDVPEDADPEDDFSADVIVMAYGGEQVRVSVQLSIGEQFRFFDSPEVSDDFMTLHIESVDIGEDDLPIASEIAVLTPRGEVGGVIRWFGEPADLLAYQSPHGFRPDEPFNFRIWNAETEDVYDAYAEFIEGDQRFQSGEAAYIRLLLSESETQTVPLDQGWNLVSSFIDPYNSDFTHIFREIHDEGNLVIVKDGRGDFWLPRYNYNGLGSWNVLEGYLVKVNDETEFDVIGIMTNSNTPIHLNAGWNMISYLLEQPMNCEIAFENIRDNLIIAKNGHGAFYTPVHDYNGLGNLIPGQGYKLNLNDSRELVYNTDERLRLMDPATAGQYIPAPTGNDMSLLITAVDLPFSVRGMELVVYAGNDDFAVGRTTFETVQFRSPLGVIVRGDDETTDVTDGACEGDALRITVKRDGEEIECEIILLSGELFYHSDGFAVIELAINNYQFPTEFVIDRIYPNPFNGFTRISFGLPEAGVVLLTIRDLAGRVVLDETSGLKYSAGWHNVEIDASSWASGIYLTELSSPSGRVVKKMILLR